MTNRSTLPASPSNAEIIDVLPSFANGYLQPFTGARIELRGVVFDRLSVRGLWKFRSFQRNRSNEYSWLTIEVSETGLSNIWRFKLFQNGQSCDMSVVLDRFDDYLTYFGKGLGIFNSFRRNCFVVMEGFVSFRVWF